MFSQSTCALMKAKPPQAPEAFAGDGVQDATPVAGTGFAAVFGEVATQRGSPLQATILHAGGKILPGSGKAAGETGNGIEEPAELGAVLPVGLAELGALAAPPVALPPASVLLDQVPASIGASAPGRADAQPIAGATVTAASALLPDPASASAPVAPSAKVWGDQQSATPALPAGDIPEADRGLDKHIAVVLREAPSVAEEPSTAAALTQVRNEASLGKPQPFATTAQTIAQPAVSARELALPTADAGSEPGGTSDRASAEGATGPDVKIIADRATGSTPFAPAGPLVSAGTERLSSSVAVLPAAVPQQFGTADAVASVVDRLMESRMLGPVAAASVSVHHADFGKLDIAFSQPGSTLDVAVSAADSESQQALAAALQAGDRGPGRDGGQAGSGSQAGTPHRSADTGGAFRGGESQSDARDADQRRQQGRPGASSDIAAPGTPSAGASRGGNAPRSGIYA